MRGKGIDDALLISTMITGSALERYLNLYKCYIDLKKAYDRVSRTILFKILEIRGKAPKLLRLIKALHENVLAQVKIGGDLTNSIHLNMGVKQGGVLSGLFWVIIEEVHKRYQLNDIKGIIIKYRLDSGVININDLMDNKCNENQTCEILYVDDCLLFATSMIELQKMVDILNEVVEIFLQEVSIAKTKYMRIIKGEIIEEVNDFKYLGVHESANGKMDLEIDKIITLMRIAYGKY